MGRLMPGYVSLSRAGEDLNRHKKTLIAWCSELNIKIRTVGKRDRYIAYRDFDRLASTSDSRPRERYKLPLYFSLWDKTLDCNPDCNTEARTARDRELARRIEAAHRWKHRNGGAEISSRAILAELAAMGVPTTTPLDR